MACSRKGGIDSNLLETFIITNLRRRPLYATRPLTVCQADTFFTCSKGLCYLTVYTA